MASEAQPQMDHLQERFAHRTNRSLIWAEDAIYALTAILLATGAVVVLVQAVYDLATNAGDGVTKAIETSLNSLLIVFILVELLSAVRVAIVKHELIAEPFLLVGILAAIKELVVLSTFRIDNADPDETVMKIGVLAGAVVVLAVATFVLRRREREPKESGDQ